MLRESNSIADAARKLSVTRTSVHGWLNSEKRHPNNPHTDKILKILGRERSKEVKEILLDELQTFKNLVLTSFEIDL